MMKLSVPVVFAAVQVEQAQMAQEAENQMKVAKVMARQRLEADALTSRGVRGRDELELRRATETEKRTYRFRNVVMVRRAGWTWSRQEWQGQGGCRRI